MRPLLLALVLLVFGRDVADAHARLVRSEPAQGAVVARAARIVLEFNSAVEQRFATFVLELADGSTKTLAPAGEDATKRIELVVPALPRGAHRLRWSVVAADGHRIKGTLAFSVGSGP